MYCTEFVFDGISSKEYDLIICSFDGNKSGSATAGSNIEYTTFKAPNSNKWVKTGSNYSEQLTFTFQICKCKCNSVINEPLSEREQAFLMRWLVRTDYKYLRFMQEGYENIYYKCQITAERYMIDGKCYGLTLNVVCDAPFGWSEEKTAKIVSDGSTTVQLFDDSDEIGILYPRVEIKAMDAGDIEITNFLTNTTTIIRNCKAGEIIVLDDGQIKSSHWFEESIEYNESDSHPSLHEDFNGEWITIGNTFTNRVNKITVSGDCEIELSWRVARKAVI